MLAAQGRARASQMNTPGVALGVHSGTHTSIKQAQSTGPAQAGSTHWVTGGGAGSQQHGRPAPPQYVSVVSGGHAWSSGLSVHIGSCGKVRHVWLAAHSMSPQGIS